MDRESKDKRVFHEWWISCVLLLLAVSFVFDIWGDKKVIREHHPVDPKYYSTDTVRHAFEKPQIDQAGYEFDCNSCHELFEAPLEIPQLIAEHEDIVLRHEPAMTCYTCHSRTNRDKLNDIYGTEIPFDESVNLCRRCHGPRYRDWKFGIHGRVIGYWDPAKGAGKNLACVYCHDPHAPKFPLMEPSPPPSRDDFITGGKAANHE